MLSQTTDKFGEAVAHARSGQFDAALAALAAHLAAHPSDSKAWAMQGSLQMETDDPQAALESYERALALSSDTPSTHINRGNALAKLDRPADALASFDKAVALLAPGLAIANSNRAQVLNRLNRPQEALTSADGALALNPRLANAWRNRGMALHTLGQPAEALQSMARGLELSPPQNRAEALCDLGLGLAGVGRYPEALKVFDESLALQDLPLTHYRRAQARLATGDFAGGWDDWESRWLDTLFIETASGHVAPYLQAPLTLKPTLDDLRGKRLLVPAEQGIGDEVMFASVLPDLARVAGKMTCIVERRLLGLFTHSFPQITFVSGRGPALVDMSQIDRVVALGSLCFVFRRSAADFPGRAYLRPAPHVVEAWRARLGPRQARLRIGVSWRGGSARTRSGARSMPLETLRPLLERPDCEIFSLQYGDVDAEIDAVNATLPRPVKRFPRAEIDDFQAQAALIDALDLVVTVQTAAAHLTGAIGQSGLVMIPERAEWRYGAAGETLPWYSSIRLFRQPAAGGWEAVVARVCEAVDAFSPIHP